MEGFIKSKVFIICLAVVGLLLIIIPGVLGSKESNITDDDNFKYYTEYLEDRLEELILQIESVDKVKVLITLDNSGENVYAQDIKSNSTEYVIIQTSNNEEGLLIKELNPAVRGVAVVCNGGSSVSLREKIVALLSSALGIPTNKITVTD